MIDVEVRFKTAIVHMNHGKVNAMDLEFCQSLSETLTGIEQGSHGDCDSAVLTGNDRVYSAGVDLVRLMKEDLDYLDPFLFALVECFKTVFRFPLPLVAAINGHAIAGGCVLATACDHRVIHAKAKIGIPELRVGVPLPSIAIETMRMAVSRQAFQQMVNIGRTYRGAEAVDVGLADRMVERDEVIAAAIESARELATIPRNVFAITKTQLRLPANRNVELNEQALDPQLHAMWRQPEIRDAIGQYVAQRL